MDAVYEQLFVDLQRSNLAAVSSLSWVLYDTIISYPEEIQYIWRAPWSLPKVLYIASRYYGLFNLLFSVSVSLSFSVSTEFCEGFKWFQSLSGAVLLTTIVNLLLLLRIYALYNYSRPLLYFLSFAYLAEFGGVLAVTWVTLNRTEAIKKPIPQLRGCLYKLSQIKLDLYAWVPVLILTGVYFILTLWKFILFLRDEKETFGFSALRKERSTQSVMSVLGMFVKDGTVFFVLVFVVLVINMFFLTLSNSALTAVAIPWLIATYTVSGSRLVLNLRKPHKATPSKTLVASDIEMRPRRTPALVFMSPEDKVVSADIGVTNYTIAPGKDSLLPVIPYDVPCDRERGVYIVQE